MAVLETARTILRPFEERDAEDLYAYAKDPTVGPAAGWKSHESVEESRKIIQTVFAAPHVFAVVEKESGKVIGSAGFVGRRHGDAYVASDEIGYALSAEFWGRGIMTEVVAELIRYGFERRALAAIWCGHYEGNERSRRVIEKNGFTCLFSQELCDESGGNKKTLLYVLLRQDWERGKERADG